ncbi:MAG: formate dehydrogenase FDH3 subunit beta [Aeromonas sp.]
MAKLKFVCDTERCIECNGCVTACKNANSDAVPWGIQRRRVVTLNDGLPGERSISVACMHCTDAPCMAVCPADCFYKTADGIVLHNKDLCIGCGYCLFACPFGAPQFPQTGAFGARGKMDKCTFCAGGPEETHSEAERKKYGANRIAEGKLPLCASLCATKALMAGDSAVLSDIMRERVAYRGAPDAGWSTSSTSPHQTGATPNGPTPEVAPSQEAP